METGFEIDYDNEFFLPRSPDFPSSRDDQCADACECRKAPCEQNCSPRLGLQNTNATCQPCAPCPDCEPDKKRPVITFEALFPFGGASNDTVDNRCREYFNELLAANYSLAYPEEEDDVVPSNVCTILSVDDAPDLCICDVTRCSCENCTDCRVCYENQIGENCLDSPVEEFPYDAEFYYRSNNTICEDECVLCPPCLDNETHVIHREVIYCNDPILDDTTRQRCLDLDNQELFCANNVLTCEEPCNCDDVNPCVPVFDPALADLPFVYCNATFEQYNTTLSNVSAGEVQCTECVPCECDDSVCGANEYVDTNFLCGTTTTPFSCGVVQMSAGLPCACTEDECEPCASCPVLRQDIWVSGTLFPTICDFGTMLLPEDEWRNSSQCITSDCFSATKQDEVCQCNCMDCTEDGYLRLLCEDAGSTSPSVCADNATDFSNLTCNSYFREDFDPNLVYYFNETSCSCTACPDMFGGCDASLGLRPSSEDPCRCEPCEDVCDGICTIPGDLCLDDGTLECVPKPVCNNSQPNVLNCSDFLDDTQLFDLFPQCEPGETFQNATCYTECVNCTGDFCLYSSDGEPLFRPRKSNERFLEDNPCICEECPPEYFCPENQTTVTLADIQLPEPLASNETVMEQLEILLAQDPPDDIYDGDYYEDLCDEECIPCSEDLCGFISDRLPALDGIQLVANTSNPCICEYCPYNEMCPDCPYCRPSIDENCACEIQRFPLLDLVLVVCDSPPECEGLAPDECDILNFAELGDTDTCIYDPLEMDDGDQESYRFIRQFTDEGCRCVYSAIDPRTPDDDDTDTDCPPRYCPPNGKVQTCQPSLCNETCVPCPNCPAGEYVPPVEREDESDWLCDGDQCECVPCTRTCPPGSYLHESTCTCIPCLEPCNQDNATLGLEVYVYPDDDSGNCTCVPCNQTDVGCSAECTDCAILIVENNVCVCDWCLPEEFEEASYDVYGRADCPLYNREPCGTDGCDEFELVDINSLGLDSNNESICLCGLKGSNVDDVPQVEVHTCPVTDNCGCCPELYEDCIAAGNLEDFCRDSICPAQLSCDGTCSSSQPMMDECGVVCGDGSSCVDDENATSVVCLNVDDCGQCGGTNDCVGCDGVANSGLIFGIDCETGEMVCGGTPEGECPTDEDDVVVVATVVGSSVGTALAGLAALSALLGMALLRRAHLQSNLEGTFDATFDETLGELQLNPLAEEANLNFEVDLEAAGIVE